MDKIKRNAPCSCGSGKKYKKCCMLKLVAPTADFVRSRIRRTEGEVIPQLEKHVTKFYGEHAFVEAIEEYFCWRGVPDDEYLELELAETIICWFYFNWVSDNGEKPVSEHLPEQTIALDYLQHCLQHNRDKIPAFTKEFIEQASANHYSFYLIESVVPGQEMVMLDILLERTFTVAEKNASQQLEPGMILYSRIITLDDTSVMLGSSPFPLPTSCHSDIIELRKHIYRLEKKLDNTSLLNWNKEIRNLYLNIREDVLFPPMPQMCNADGDPLQPMTMYYDLFCTPQEALDKLKTLTKFKTDEELLSMAKYKKNQLYKITIPWLEKGNKQRNGIGKTLMGELTVDGSRLMVSVNSENRADQIQRKISRRLGKYAFFKVCDYESMAHLMEQEQMQNEAPEIPALEDMPAEMQEVMAEMAKKHWEEWLTIPVPALNNKTPRQAAKTKAGRELLHVLLLDFESRDTSENLFAPDVGALRRELEMDKKG